MMSINLWDSPKDGTPKDGTHQGRHPLRRSQHPPKDINPLRMDLLSTAPSRKDGTPAGTAVPKYVHPLHPGQQSQETYFYGKILIQ